MLNDILRIVSGVLACRSLTRYFWLSLRLTTMADVQLDLFYCCLSVLCISRSSQCHWIYPRWHRTATPSQKDGADDTCADTHTMSSDDVTGVVLIKWSYPAIVKPNQTILTDGWCWWYLCWHAHNVLRWCCWCCADHVYPVKVKLYHRILTNRFCS